VEVVDDETFLLEEVDREHSGQSVCGIGNFDDDLE